MKEDDKMAEDTDQGVLRSRRHSECSEPSKNVKSELKKTILESVNTLRNIIHALKKDIDKSAKTIELQIEVEEVKRDLQAYKDARPTILVAPSIERTKKPEASMSDAQRRPSDKNMKLYSEIAAGRENNRKFKITVRSKESHTPENMKELLKTRINPT